MQIRRSSAQRDQRPDEDVMQYLDALESLRNQGHQKESRTERRYEILQRFIEGVRNQNLRESLSAMYAHEDYLEKPPTVEEIRFATQQYLRTRGSYRDRAQQNQPNQNRQPLQPVQPRPVPQPNVLPQPTNNPIPIPLNPQPLPNERQQEMPAAQKTPTTTDHVSHANNMVTLPENVPTGIKPKFISHRYASLYLV